jgi:hypothetical protein
VGVNGLGPEPRDPVAVAFDVVPLGRRGRRLDPGLIAVALAVVFVGAAILQPWAEGALPSLAVASPAIGSPAVASGALPARHSPSPSAASTVPAARAAADLLILDPASDAQHWGIALGAGSSPHGGPASDANSQVPVISMSLDGSWSAWAPVQLLPSPAPADGSSSVVAGLKPAELCQGLPDLPSGAQVVAVTSPGGPRDDVVVEGWQVVGWHDEPRDVQPVASMRGLTTDRSGTITYLEQPGGKPWPDGRYEFQMRGLIGASISICLGQL